MDGFLLRLFTAVRDSLAQNSPEANETSGGGELGVGHVLHALSSICIFNQVTPHRVPLETKFSGKI